MPNVSRCRARAVAPRRRIVDGRREVREVDAADRADEACRPECACRRRSDHTAQLTPSSAFLFTVTSTMIASTSTCARRMSSLSMTAISERMIFGGAVMTSALVSGSAQIVVERSALAATPPPPRRPRPARRAVMATVALICSLSLVGELLGVRVTAGRRTCVSPPLSSGVSRCATSALMRRRCVLVAADEHAVGAVVRDHARRRAAAAFAAAAGCCEEAC